ncbi:Hypothetical protein RMHFA_02695 [Roseomonas mucosa]|uniref:Uncharacterized protein conserved in bacteria n=1 Tax=Roseomonas mucosa TaxID=207340 RepID=A0A1S8D8M2_9PROT|nr:MULTISPECIES: ClpXP protease specificity-enhancing factor SspB [Roseomonas]MBS5902352.1 hypothetical protein [Acetobacteraceae bacterium]MDT8262162.1 ClpXP protease specificity-enhancing factor SspB [Roseomonas sp. DSM 102946]ATR22977.1 hypothetical protein CTJ15_23515 [Roseomonas sp. FDAARGOS_362]AWV23962.1 Hypothetical protein RADP37_02695 [Roseomonas mucosa]MCG7350874.1 ClpXP protease specificity-enhancing factor SspB [Roseomonas mucosa]
MSDQPPLAESLLPYDRWTEDAMREVALRALEHAAEHGLPGEHHFYLSFRTDAPGTVVPGHLRAKYPQEMTVVLQHQFWDLKVDREARQVSVGLSFGGTPSTLVIPFDALTGFLDPHVRVGLRFNPPEGVGEMPEEPSLLPPAEARPAEPEAPPPPSGPAEVVSLDAFRRRPSGRD